jgi:hypothetical protein
MRHWLTIFLKGPRKPVLGLTEEAIRSIKVPTIVVPGNDLTHASGNGFATAALIEGSILYSLPIEDQNVPLLPFSDWAPHEAALASRFAEFMNSVEANTRR